MSVIFVSAPKGQAIYYSNYNPSRSYAYFDSLLKKAQLLRDTSAVFSNSKHILDVLLRNDSNENLWWKYFEILTKSDKSIGNYVSALYENKIIIQSCYRDAHYSSVSIDNWEILFILSKKDLPIRIQIHSLYAKYLELTEIQNERAIEQYKLVLQISDSLSFNSDNYKFGAICNIANVYQNQEKPDSAITLYKVALSIKTPSNKVYNNTIRLYSWISDCFLALNQYDSAYHYMQLTHETLVNAEKTKHDVAISELERKYNYEKKEKELLVQKESNRKFYIASLSLGGLLSISLIGLWGLRRINKLKQLTLNQEIKDTQQQGQLAAINAQLDGEEQERKRVASVLHDGISSHLTAASFHLQLLTQNKVTNQQAVSKAADLIEEAAERSRELSHQLYPPILIKHGLVAALEALSSSFTNASLTYKVVNILTIKSINTNLESKLYYIISEVMQNVLKHSQATHCELHISNIEDMLKVNIKDNGIGIHKNTNSTGLGLSSIHARIQSLNGTVQISTNDGIGTTVVMEVPLM